MKTKLYSEHRRDLEKSGLSLETIKKAGLNSIDAKGYFKKAGVKSLLVFPYKNNPKAKRYYRYKLFPSIKDKRGKKMKYYTKKDSSNHLYITEQADIVSHHTEDPLYFTEGEKKALALSQHELAAIGLSGLWNWTNRGEKKLIEDFNLFDFDGRVVYLIPDNDYEDEKHKGSLILAIKFLATYLSERGAKVRIIKIPYGDEKGIDDYLCRHGINKFNELVNDASPFISNYGLMNDDPRDLIFKSHDELKDYFEKAKPSEYISRPPRNKLHFFAEEIAIEFGLPAAIVLQKLHNWIKYNYEKHPFAMIKDNRTWVFRGYKNLQSELPYYSENTIIRAIRKLEKLNVLIPGNYNKRSGDMTKWYSIDYIKLEELLK